MQQMEDIRWKQRFSNFNMAFAQLEYIVQMDHLNDIEEQGLIKAIFIECHLCKFVPFVVSLFLSTNDTN
jgi:hypothetical protein